MRSRRNMPRSSHVNPVGTLKIYGARPCQPHRDSRNLRLHLSAGVLNLGHPSNGQCSSRASFSRPRYRRHLHRRGALRSRPGRARRRQIADHQARSLHRPAGAMQGVLVAGWRARSPWSASPPRWRPMPSSKAMRARSACCSRATSPRRSIAPACARRWAAIPSSSSPAAIGPPGRRAAAARPQRRGGGHPGPCAQGRGLRRLGLFLGAQPGP